MISILILIILAWSFYIGYSRGLVLQAFYCFSCLLALFIAAGSYQKLAAVYYLWVPFANATEGASTYYFDSKYLFDLDQIFYAGLAFLTIYLLAYIIMRFLGIFMHLIRYIGSDSPKVNLISGALSVLVTIVSLQVALTILATIPVPLVQDSLQDSFLANAIIHTPLTSQWFRQLWVINTIG